MRVERELDVKELVKKQMRLKILMRVLLGPVERVLLNNNRSFIANFEVSDSGSNGENQNEDMKLQSKEQCDRDSFLGRLDALYAETGPKLSKVSAKRAAVEPPTPSYLHEDSSPSPCHI